MDRYDLALIGFGGVNRALAEIIVQRGDDLARELGFALRVVAVTDLQAGSLVEPDGIDLAPLLSTQPQALSFAGWTGGSADPRNEWVIRHVPSDIVVRPEVRAADRTGDHLHDGVRGGGQRCVGYVAQPDVAGGVDRGGAHGGHPFNGLSSESRTSD